MPCQTEHSEAWVRARKWIKRRAKEIAKETIEEYGKEKGERVAYALATEQAHKLGITPPSYGNPISKQLAKRKYKKPVQEYQKKAAAELPIVTRKVQSEAVKLLNQQLKTYRQALRVKTRAPNYGNRFGLSLSPASEAIEEIELLRRFGG